MPEKHQARKRFGQHFLHDKNIIRNIVDACDVKYDENVIEIGPGQGAITNLLLEELAHLHVIEIDHDLIFQLKKRNEFPQRLSIHETDILKFDFNTINKFPIKIIGNLPYNISTPIIFHLTQYKELIDEMVFMLQKEVVDRMIAKPGSKDYGRLSVMTQIHFHIEKLFDVSKHCFSPTPKVMSTVFRLRPRVDLLQQIQNEDTFSCLVKTAFSQRRKTIRNSLRTLLDSETISSQQINPEARPENLGINDFISLANLCPDKEN